MEPKPGSVLDASAITHKRRPRLAWDNLKLTISVFAVPASLFGAALLGGIIRGDSSPYAWRQWAIDAAKHGTGDAVFGALWYLALYACVIAIPYWLVGFAVRSGVRQSTIIRLVCGFWFLLTCLIFADSFIAFLRNLPTDILNGWLIIGWGAATYFAARAVALLLREGLRR